MKVLLLGLLTITSTLVLAREAKQDIGGYVKCLKSLESENLISAPVGKYSDFFDAIPGTRNGARGIYIVRSSDVNFVPADSVRISGVNTPATARDRLRFNLTLDEQSYAVGINATTTKEEGRTILVKGFSEMKEVLAKHTYEPGWDAAAENAFIEYLRKELEVAQEDYLGGKRTLKELTAHLGLLESCKVLEDAEKLEKIAIMKSGKVAKRLRIIPL